MRNMIGYFGSLLLACVVVSVGVAQHAEEDIILRAMKDELNRNMKELRHPEYDKPFFIMYGVQDQKVYSVAGSLGSIIHSKEDKSRFKSSTRVLVGDYGFNDESLEDNLTSSPTAQEIGLPEDDDYMGIRRSFWSSTDKVYRDAARHFQRHQQTLKESGKPLAEIPHRTFAKGKAATIMPVLTPYSFDKTSWENKVRELSGIFVEHPELAYSSVMVSFTEGHRYLVNNEGVVAKLPFRNASFICLAQLKGHNGEFVVDQVVHHASYPGQFPSTEKLKEQIEQMISRIKTQLDIPVFTEEYAGPVLLCGPVVADVFASVLLNNAESIIANNFIPALTGFQYSRNNSMDTKIGKTLFSPMLTVVAKPTMKTYKGVELLGSFEMDDEGIKPPDELVIVENGILKSLLNDRTLTHETQLANGFASGPGVIEVSVKEKYSEKVLKEKLLSEAKEQGLDYAMIIRKSSTMMGIMNVYKVSVSDGKEVLVRNALLGELNAKTLRRIGGASEQQTAHNHASQNFLRGNSGQTVSYILPSSILIKEMEVKPFDMPTLQEEEYVPNPLSSIK